MHFLKAEMATHIGSSLSAPLNESQRGVRGGMGEGSSSCYSLQLRCCITGRPSASAVSAQSALNHKLADKGETMQQAGNVLLLLKPSEEPCSKASCVLTRLSYTPAPSHRFLPADDLRHFISVPVSH